MKPVLIVNPADDARFSSEAHALVDGGTDTPARLQRALRERYPRAVVRARGLSSEPSDVWYVYREGIWTPPSGRGDR
jgi:hypothetical protein